jgi:hypothetical protein
VRVADSSGVGVAAHRKPNHAFRLVGIVVLVIGTIAGGYLGFGRQRHPQVAAAVPMYSAPAPSFTIDPAIISAATSAKAKADAAASAAAAQASHANQVAGRQDPASRSTPRPPYPVPASCKTFTGNREIGCGLLLDGGWNIDQMPCLDNLWTKESHWNVTAVNSGSGAYGIPQALPGDKMAAYGADWQTNPAPQIKWGLAYIKSRYGSPCSAWAHSQQYNWY